MKYIRTKDGRILKGSNYGFGVGMPYKNYDVKVAHKDTNTPKKIWAIQVKDIDIVKPVKN